MKNTTLEKYDVEAKTDTSASLRNVGRSVIRALRLFEAASILKSRQAEARGGNQQLEVAQQIPRKAIDTSVDTGRHHIASGEHQQKTVDELIEKRAREQREEQRQWEQQFDPSELAEVRAKQNHYRMALEDPNLMVAPDEIYGMASHTPPLSGNQMPSNSYGEQRIKAIPVAEYQIPHTGPHDTN